jgi:RNA polymerase sigma-70 factor (ECF subfamily)
LELRPDSELINDYVKNKSNKSAYILVEKYRSFVFSVALRYTNSYDDAEDLSQEVFIKAFENLHKFEFKSSLKTWLYRIAMNTFLNSKKTADISNKLTKSEDAELENYKNQANNPHEELEYNELFKGFENALHNLPERQREVFSLRYFEQMKYEEISDLLGVSVGGLKANYFHALKKLNEQLKDFIIK